VDCKADGNASELLNMKIEKSGLKAEFWRGEEGDNFTERVVADVKRIDSRVDYWLTNKGWDGLPDTLSSNFYGLWQGYLKVTIPGDYEFTLGSSDDAALKWFHPSSQTWAIFEHRVRTEFEYSSTTDHTPETLRKLDTGYHKFRLEFSQRNQGGAGFVFKYKGADTQGVWQVVPSNALAVEPPGCSDPELADCAEGAFIPGATDCTLVCKSGGEATPAAVQCVVDGLSAALQSFECSIPTPAPTVQPTVSPTVSPTASPTARPTAAPTAEPTAQPTSAPTATPTVSPTANPTFVPTAAPTQAPHWPACWQNETRIKTGDEDLFADLVDYGAVSGCKDGECADTDELDMDKIKRCALICATVTNCRFWTWGPEASQLKCWLRTGNSSATNIVAEAAGFLTGARDCYPDAEFGEEHDHPPTAEVVTFSGGLCPAGSKGEGLDGKDFLRLGTSVSGLAFYYSKALRQWLYWDDKCDDVEPSWVLTSRPPKGGEGPAGPCEPKASSTTKGTLGGPSSGMWQVDCNGDGSGSPTYTSLPMIVDKSGLVAEFYKGSNSSQSTDKDADVTRIDPRIDYWLTNKRWDGIPMKNDFFVAFTGYLKVWEAGDYEFTIGASDYTQLMWYHEESDSWATFDHKVEEEFEYSSTTDHTPETTRTLDSGFHKLQILFSQQKPNAPAGLVFKYKGADTQDEWRVVPTEAMTVEVPGCIADMRAGNSTCAEGGVIASGGTCTVACGEGETAEPASVKCRTQGLTSTMGAFKCVSPTTTTTTTTAAPTTTTTTTTAAPTTPAAPMPDVDSIPSIVPDPR
jgi:hypothetical protein